MGEHILKIYVDDRLDASEQSDVIRGIINILDVATIELSYDYVEQLDGDNPVRDITEG